MNTSVSSAGDAALGWGDRALTRYTWTMVVVTAAAALAVHFGGGVSKTIGTALMTIAVALVGLPHGAYDLAVGRRLLAPRWGRAGVALFVIAYVVLAGFAALFWIWAPWAGLGLLLAGGALHWGEDDLDDDGAGFVHTWLALSRGLLPVAAPLVFFPERTAEIFAALTGAAEIPPDAVARAGITAGVFALPGIVVPLLRRQAVARARTTAEIAVLVVWFAVATPLVAFTLYFCFWHSVRHALRAMARIDPRGPGRAFRRYLGAVAAPTVATWVLGGAAWWILSGMPGRFGPETLWQVVFVGLFALTVPHVLLEWFETKAEAQATNEDAVAARTASITR